MLRTTTSFNKVWGLVALLLMLPALAGATVEETRNITKSFAVLPNAAIDIHNKYGEIKLETWDKDSVRIMIELRAKASNRDRLAKLLDEVSFDFSNTEYYITARTEITGQRTQLLKEFSDIAELIYSGDNKVTIDYRVYVPKSARLEIENRYGNVYCSDVSSEFRLDIQHGSFYGGKLTGHSDISLKFGDGRVHDIKDGRMVLEYADFQLNNADRLVVQSKSSTIDIREINDLRATSRRDKYRIDKVNVMNGGSSFTDYFVDQLDRSINMDMRYGTLNIERIPGSVDSFSIASEYTNLDLNLEYDSGYEVDVSTKNVDFRYPENAKINKSVTDDNERVIYKGSIGSGGGPTLRVRATNCDVRIDR